MLDASARGAWELLADRLGAFISRRLSADDAEDVRQEVLLRIIKGAPHLNDEARFGPWVYSCRAKCRDRPAPISQAAER